MLEYIYLSMMAFCEVDKEDLRAGVQVRKAWTGERLQKAMEACASARAVG